MKTWKLMTRLLVLGWVVFLGPLTCGHGGGREKSQDPPVTHDLRVSLHWLHKDENLTQASDGRTTRSEDKILTVEVKKGWKEGTKITFPKEGDETPTNVPADVVFVVKDKPHPVYRRDGSDIIYPAKITLKEALCGSTVTLTTLDGHKVPITAQYIVRPGTKRHVTGEGLHLPKSPDHRGDMIVEFEIKFPDRLSQSAMDTISSVLPAS